VLSTAPRSGAAILCKAIPCVNGFFE